MRRWTTAVVAMTFLAGVVGAGYAQTTTTPPAADKGGDKMDKDKDKAGKDKGSKEKAAGKEKAAAKDKDKDKDKTDKDKSTEKSGEKK